MSRNAFASGLPLPRGSAPPSARALTLWEAALVANYNNHRPIFTKTVVALPTPVGPQLPTIGPQHVAPAQLWSFEASQASQSSSLSANSFASSKPSCIPRAVYMQKQEPKTGKTPNLPQPHVINFDYVDLFCASTPGNPSLWEAALLFRQRSKTVASLGRTNCATDITREIIATAFSKRASGMGPLTNLARFAGAFFQFALTNDIPPAGEDALVTAAQWIKPMRARGHTVPRGALYALRVMNEAIWLQLPLTTPVVLGAARAHRSKIRNQAPLMPYTLVGEILLLTQNSSMPFGLRAFASGISLMIIATFRWADAQWITEINKNDAVVFGICQRTKSNSALFYWASPLEGF